MWYHEFCAVHPQSLVIHLARIQFADAFFFTQAAHSTRSPIIYPNCSQFSINAHPVNLLFGFDSEFYWRDHFGATAEKCAKKNSLRSLRCAVLKPTNSERERAGTVVGPIILKFLFRYRSVQSNEWAWRPYYGNGIMAKMVSHG